MENIMKKCYKCNLIKDLSHFSKDKARPDGMQSKCKECSSRYCKTEEYKSSKLNYRRSDKGKQASKRSYENNKNASISSRRFNNKIQSGAIKKRFMCSKCSILSTHIEAHHCDYNFPYDVIWLCKSCHVEWHNNNKPLNSKYGIFNKNKKDK